MTLCLVTTLVVTKIPFCDRLQVFWLDIYIEYFEFQKLEKFSFYADALSTLGTIMLYSDDQHCCR